MTETQSGGASSTTFDGTAGPGATATVNADSVVFEFSGKGPQDSEIGAATITNTFDEAEPPPAAAPAAVEQAPAFTG